LQPETLTILSLGFVLGLKHALDADHLIAVATIVSDRKGWLSSSIVGIIWGIGHTLALLLIGLLVIAMQLEIPERVTQFLEFGVAAMLIVLGVNVLWKLYKGELLHLHLHKHHGHKHIHPHIHSFTTNHEHNESEQNHHAARRSWLDRLFKHVNEQKRSMLIGMIHGVAGSAGLMLIILATISSRKLGLLYIAVFGIGSIGGMMLMSTLIGLPFVLTSGKSLTLNKLVRAIAGITSLAFGIFLAWQIGVAEGLLIPR